MNAVIVKVGGSLALFPEKLRNLCEKINEISKEYKLIVVPGGGEFADVVRSIDRRFRISCNTSHRMAILGMDQYGMLLSDLMPGSITTHKLEEINNYFYLNKLPIFLPSHEMCYTISGNFYLNIEQHRQIRLRQAPQSTFAPLKFRLFLSIKLSTFQGITINCHPLLQP